MQNGRNTLKLERYMLRRIFLILVAALILRAVMSDSGVGDDRPEAGLPSADVAVSAPKAQAAPIEVPRWEYSEQTDEITGKAYRIASLRSVNSLSLSAPYRGSNYGRLHVRDHPQYGLDVYVTVQRGQILCRGSDYWTCIFKIRFDDEEPERFTAKRAADGSSRIVFSAYPKWAVGKLKDANRITIQLLMYKAGNQVLTFEIDEPLKW